MIYTVLPLKPHGVRQDLPSDFPTYAEALEYAEEKYESGGYVIEQVDGECC